MGKALLLSIQPEWVAKILNKEKTYEIRRKIPTDYVGWVYIYCTKHNKFCFKDIWADKSGEGKLFYIDNREHDRWSAKLNGKVVARFWCDKIAIIKRYTETENIKSESLYCFDYWADKPLPEANMDIQKGSCLTTSQLNGYVEFRKQLYAMHIQRLEIFDKPKDLIEFEYRKKYTKCANCPYNNRTSHVCMNCEEILPVKRPPQNFMYVESEN